MRAVIATVEKGSNLYTDTTRQYGKGRLLKLYQHEMINHARESVRGQVHTNGLANFWSLLKRAIKGTYVSIDPFDVFRYVDEQVFRFNLRGANDRGRFLDAVGSIVGKRLTYRSLTGAGLSIATTQG